MDRRNKKLIQEVLDEKAPLRVPGHFTSLAIRKVLEEGLGRLVEKQNGTPEEEAKPAFGLFDYSMLPKLNRILKPHGLRLKQKTNSDWGDQVEITVERL